MDTGSVMATAGGGGGLSPNGGDNGRNNGHRSEKRIREESSSSEEEHERPKRKPWPIKVGRLSSASLTIRDGELSATPHGQLRGHKSFVNMGATSAFGQVPLRDVDFVYEAFKSRTFLMPDDAQIALRFTVLEEADPSRVIGEVDDNGYRGGHSGRQQGLCGNRSCGANDHELVDCWGPVSEEGDLRGCVLCNDDGHDFDFCPRMRCIDVERLIFHLVERRANLPPVRTMINTMDLLLAGQPGIMVESMPLTKSRVVADWIPNRRWETREGRVRDPALPGTMPELLEMMRVKWETLTREFTFLPRRLTDQHEALANNKVRFAVPANFIPIGVESMRFRGFGWYDDHDAHIRSVVAQFGILIPPGN
ncbi:hypothetical protein B0T19DRAFT_404477 [Cercophora scortea]|uniref:Uncharacterized protein n=1 Tax=Cercophora scortea TaxID=314031 RepID=A0AAE0I7G3_9PEZI|nr:hypothetical protein B0T19DRAFT_404477 [Cercophora scortea]